MKITKQDDHAYVMQAGGITLTVLDTGHGWGFIGDTPSMLLGKYATVNAARAAFVRYLESLKFKAAVNANPLTDIEVPLKGTILDPNLEFGPPPRRSQPETQARDIAEILPLPKRRTS